jgi:hypothetical protein
MRLVPSPSSRPLSHWLARAPWVLRDLEKEEGAEGGRVERKAGTKCGGRDRPFKGPGERLGTLSLPPPLPTNPRSRILYLFTIPLFLRSTLSALGKTEKSH